MELVPFNSKVEAAENGDVDMMMEVAVAYFNGEDGLADVEKNPEKASYWMLKAAKNGKPEAMFNIGLFYAHGFGVSRSFENAAEWMEKAVDAGETDALEVARQYRKGAESLTRAEAGNPQAQADYAIALMTAGNALNQINSSSIYEESVEWAQKANGNDNGESYLVLGLAYEKGRGVEQDTNKAVEFYAKGEEKGQEICMNNLGRLYMIGDAVPKDEEKAFELFLKSAEKGYGVAMQNVAQCYERENGTEYNIDKAIEWYEKSLKVLPNNELEQKVAFYKRLKSDGSLSFESG
jgi:hypothetical protein